MTMTTEHDKNARLESEAEAAAMNAADRVPEPTDWGFCAWGDAPPAIGGGMPVFMWFPSRDDMVTYLRDHVAFLFPAAEDLSHDGIATGVTAVVAAHGQRDGLGEVLRADINPRLAGSTQIDWIGSYAELKTGAGEFPRRIRTEFREDEDGGDDPITEDDVEAFGDFTRAYGV